MWRAGFEAHAGRPGQWQMLSVHFDYSVPDRSDPNRLVSVTAHRVFHSEALGGMRSDVFLGLLRMFALEVLTHELDESLQLDGRLVSDPHASPPEV